jgi:hypothetical protein
MPVILECSANKNEVTTWPLTTQTTVSTINPEVKGVPPHVVETVRLNSSDRWSQTTVKKRKLRSKPSANELDWV